MQRRLALGELKEFKKLRRIRRRGRREGSQALVVGFGWCCGKSGV